ncbi:MAG: archaeal proteasome endopeptidase complex subunit alpha [Nanoarchaeota archaeon]
MDMPTEMQHQAMGYDRAATMFSPDGHLLQVEYAEKAVKSGSSSIGLACKDGVVIVADRRIRDNLVAPESMNKVYEVDEHIVASSAGILSDARILIEQAQILAQQNRITFDSPIEPISIIKMIADKKQMFTQYGGVRPYGVAIIVAGVHRGKSHLYASDMVGNYLAYRANAIGENDEKVKEALRKEFNENMTIEDSIKLSLRIFKQVLDKNFDISRFDVGYIKIGDAKLVRMHGDELKRFVK